MHILKKSTVVLITFILLTSCADFKTSVQKLDASMQGISLEEYQEGVENKNEVASYSAGITHLRKHEVIAAIKQLEPLAKNGDVRAQNAMGDAFYYGYQYNVPAGQYISVGHHASLNGKLDFKMFYLNRTIAAKWYTQAAEQGDAEAMYTLGKQFYDGDGVIQNYPVSHMWLNIASSLGHEDAGKLRDHLEKNWLRGNWLTYANKLASSCQKNSYKECAPLKDYSIAPDKDFVINRSDDYFANTSKINYSSMDINTLKQLALDGNRDAQYFLATFYEKGKGTLKNMNEAIKWYTSSAKLNHALALHRLGIIYSEGLGGITVDYSKSKKYLKSSASLGYRDSMIKLGKLIYDGKISIKGNKNEVAYMWFNMAHSTVYYFASTLMSEVNDFNISGRERINSARSFSQDKMKKAQDITYNCVKSNMLDCS